MTKDQESVHEKMYSTKLQHLVGFRKYSEYIMYHVTVGPEIKIRFMYPKLNRRIRKIRKLTTPLEYP